MPFIFEQTKLWKNGFALGGNVEEKRHIRQSYCRFWERACELAKLISSDLPGLTLHDEKHFEALWKRADQIAGDDYLLNPIELFVFGGGILLHDAGLTLAAYKGGLAQLQETVEWRDAAALLEFNQRESKGAAEIQFEVLRQLHASRAEDLADLTVTLPDSSDTLHLIEDEGFRRHFGLIIGQIAASHHWDLHIVERKLPVEVGALAGFPFDWTIRPIVLACLLRCADATQVDQARAPDFSYALLRGDRESEKHWRAQNRLAQPFVTGDALTYTSTRTFGVEDAEAWWLAADALLLAHKELENCNRLLADLHAKPFAVRGIRDAMAADRLQAHIRVSGWEPVSVGTTISNPRVVIKLLGGQLLYEEEGLAVPMRELIQNATDAVRARKALEPPDALYKGWVAVGVEDAGDELHDWIIVEDNGVGMPQRVMTGPLIDFGHSLWRSALVKEILPGFASKRVDQTGRYGIGFYSTMMVSGHVMVSSRPYNAGLEAIATAHFPKGVLHHGVLLKGSPDRMGMSVCTRVKMKVRKDVVREFLEIKTKSPYESGEREDDESPPSIALEDRLEILCVAVDCDIHSKFRGAETVLAHKSAWRTAEPSSWLDRLLLPAVRNRSDFRRAVDLAAPNLRDVMDGTACRGRAAITFYEGTGLELPVVQGFNVRPPSTSTTGPQSRLAGFIESESTGPRRGKGEYRISESSLAAWASDQALLLAKSGLTPEEAYYAAIHVSNFGGSASPVANLLINGKFQNIIAISEILLSGEKIVVPLHIYDWPGLPKDRIGNMMFNLSGFLSVPRSAVNLSTAIRYLGESLSHNHSDEYFVIDSREKADGTRVVDCIRSLLSRKGYSMVISLHDEYDFGTYIGPDMETLHVKSGEHIIQRAAKLSARNLQTETAAFGPTK